MSNFHHEPEEQPLLPNRSASSDEGKRCQKGNSYHHLNDPADELFLQASEIPDAGERATFLAESCGNDPDLLARIEAMLPDEVQADLFLGESESNRGGETTVQDCATVESGIAGEQEGQWIGRYRLLQQIGEGGFGSVWMAEQTEPVMRRVALKIIKQGMGIRQADEFTITVVDSGTLLMENPEWANSPVKPILTFKRIE